LGVYTTRIKPISAGSSAPDCQLILLGKNQSVRLSDYWIKNDLVVEFGSLT
jgi:hypothetical protein